MNIVIFTHPEFFRCTSISRYTKMLAEGMAQRGHKVKVWAPKPRFVNFPAPRTVKKWLGYVDQYVLFPSAVQGDIASCSTDTLFVFADQALGPWVPLVMNRPHVVHCHDLLAQRSALGMVSENKTRWAGRQYQSIIRNGFKKGKFFISVSDKTKHDLEQFLVAQPIKSEVVYNGLNQTFFAYGSSAARSYLSEKLALELKGGYLLHVGGNQWYKNRCGVVDMYNAWRNLYNKKQPLLLVGEEPNLLLRSKIAASVYKDSIHVLTTVNDKWLNMAYSGASVFLFPSLDEGFGWPIIEAMAAGCPVLTTGVAPMTEVAGNAAFLVPRKPAGVSETVGWANRAARTIDQILSLTSEERQGVVEAGFANVKRFNPDEALDKIEAFYCDVLSTYSINETVTCY